MEERQQKLESYVARGGACDSEAPGRASITRPSFVQDFPGSEHGVATKVGGWFPEGRINPGDPHVVERFRAGGMWGGLSKMTPTCKSPSTTVLELSVPVAVRSLAVHVDAEVWVISFVGNAVPA